MRWWLAAMAAGCAGIEEPCRLRDSLDELAGDGALACGSFAADADPSEGWACATDAWTAGTAFTFDYAEGSTDSAVLQGIAFDGQRTFFLYQGKDRGVLRDVDGRECLSATVEAPPAPTTTYSTGTDADAILTCDDFDPVDRVWLFCTTDEGEADQVPFPG